MSAPLRSAHGLLGRDLRRPSGRRSRARPAGRPRSPAAACACRRPWPWARECGRGRPRRLAAAAPRSSISAGHLGVQLAEVREDIRPQPQAAGAARVVPGRGVGGDLEIGDRRAAGLEHGQRVGLGVEGVDRVRLGVPVAAARDSRRAARRRPGPGRRACRRGTAVRLRRGRRRPGPCRRCAPRPRPGSAGPRGA